jgi:Protein of unknown function (DUF998)
MQLTMTRPQTATASRTRNPFARFAFAAAVAFLAFLAAVHIAKPDLDPAWQPISAFALGDHGWLMSMAFLTWGASAIALAVALAAHARTLVGRIGVGFLVLGGCGPILAAIFPMDPLTTPPDAMTTSGVLHVIGATLGDGIPIGAALLTWSLVRNNPEWAAARVPLIATLVVTWIAWIAVTAGTMVLLPQAGGQLGPDVPLGFHNRFLIVAYAAWIMTAAQVAIRSGRYS